MVFGTGCFRREQQDVRQTTRRDPFRLVSEMDGKRPGEYAPSRDLYLVKSKPAGKVAQFIRQLRNRTFLIDILLGVRCQHE